MRWYPPLWYRPCGTLAAQLRHEGLASAQGVGAAVARSVEGTNRWGGRRSDSYGRDGGEQRVVDGGCGVCGHARSLRFLPWLKGLY